MIVFLLCSIFITYMFIVYIIVKFKNDKRFHCDEFPRLTLKKDRITFNSYGRHKIKILGFDMVLVKDCLYLFNASKIIIIENVNKAELHENYLYFSALGEVIIYLELKEFYRYFAIIIKSEKFNMDNLKQKAILDILNHNFEANNSEVVRKYIKIIKNILNIDVLSKKIVIKPNKYRLPFQLTYKLNNKIKHIKVE